MVSRLTTCPSPAPTLVDGSAENQEIIDMEMMEIMTFYGDPSPKIALVGFLFGWIAILFFLLQLHHYFLQCSNHRFFVIIGSRPSLVLWKLCVFGNFEATLKLSLNRVRPGLGGHWRPHSSPTDLNIILVLVSAVKRAILCGAVLTADRLLQTVNVFARERKKWTHWNEILSIWNSKKKLNGGWHRSLRPIKK